MGCWQSMKKERKPHMKKFFALCLSGVLLALSVIGVGATGEAPELVYDTYIYDNSDNPLLIPAAYQPEAVYTGASLGVGTFSDLSDLFYDGDGRLFLCDTRNNRVLVFSPQMELLHEISTFEQNGTTDAMDAPTGVFANDELILVCDSNNGRLLLFHKNDYSFYREIGEPEISILKERDGSYTYKPIKAVMDNAGRFYVIADGVNQGLVRLDQDGTFISFVGAPTVVPNAAEMIWRKFATKAQKDQMRQYIPTEYDSLWIDEDGFIYATSMTSETMPVVRLNSKGTDILPEVEYYGDSSQTTYDTEVLPYFNDVAVDENGSYFVLDSAQGKIYAYSADGALLYAFGTNAFQQGAFYSASALEFVGEKLVVTDQTKGTLTVFAPTEFGKSINTAMTLYEEGKNEQAREAYLEVERLCSNYYPATVAISYIDYQNGEYDNALSQLKKINDHENYSKVFENVRNDFIRQYFVWLLAAAVVLIAAVFTVRYFAKRSKLAVRLTSSGLYTKYHYGTYVMFHPFDGFWDIKREGRGDLRSASLILLLFILLYGIRAQFSGYTVTETISSKVNALYECLMILMPLAFYVIANWCFTTLMDGKGSMKDIYIATCYALKPYVVLSIPLLVLSHVLTSEEAMFYQLLDTFCLLWVLALLFFGMMTIHDYSLWKGILAAILTLVGICLIIFLLLLMISVVQNVADFALNIYKELSLRLYD